MISRTLLTAVLTLAGAGASALGAMPPYLAEPESARPLPARVGTGSAPQQGDVLIPGGQRFIRAAAGMRVAPSAVPDPEDFLADLAGYLSAPMVLDYAERVEAMVEELRAVQGALAELDEEYGDVVPSLAERDTTAYAKGVALLDFLGFRVLDDTDRIQLQRRVGDRQARQRQLLGYLGMSVPLQSRLWAAGDPITLAVEDESVPLPFGADAWRAQVFDEDIDASGMFDALIADPSALRVLAGYAELDRPTQSWLFAQVGLGSLHADARVAGGFLRLAPYLRVVDDSLHFPGGDEEAWSAIVGGWNDTTDLIEKLATRDEGRAAHLWRALSLVPEERARYLLTLDRATRGERVSWARELYASIRSPGFADAIRWPEDTAELFTHLRLLPDGSGIDWPGGARVWLAAIEGDDRLEQDGSLEALLDSFATGADSGPTVDGPLIRGILRDSEPDRDEPTATRKLLAVSGAIRYQPISAMRDAIPLLYRNYRAFGRAYGFFVMPTPLPEGTAVSLVRHLQKVDAIESEEVRIDSIRQLQASMVLLHRVLLNDLLTDEDRNAIIDSFLDLPVAASRSDATGGGAVDLGYGTAVTEWWRLDLVPALARGLQANGWPGDPADLRRVVVTALVGRIGVAELDVDGIDYSYVPAAQGGRRMYTHLLLQQQPSFENIFRLDEIAAQLATAGGPEPATSGGPELADEIETIVAELESQVPPNIGDEDVTEALPVTIARDQLFERSDTVVSGLRAGAVTPTDVTAFREAVNVYLGDALVGITYALFMGDPASFTYQQGHIAWLHRLIIAELGGDGPEDLFSPWAATSESWILDEGSRLHNSLFGAADTLSRWNLEDLMPSGGPRDPVAAETWASAIARIHLPSLTADAQSVVARRHALAGTWIREAVQARDPSISPSFWVSADATAEAPRLDDALRLLMRPRELQVFRDAVTDGRESDALRAVSDGNRYLVVLALDDYDAAAPAAARWLLDQAVGMPMTRRGDYLGLMTPPAIPLGEAGDESADPFLYARMFDIRVRLAVLMEEQVLPAALNARLLMGAMARVLSTMVPTTYRPWTNILATVDAELNNGALSQTVVDLAFTDELTPSDPNLALEQLAGAAGDAAGGPAGRTGTLGLPVNEQQYEAAFGASVEMVTVDVGAWDNDDNFITDLTLDDITLTRDGEPVTPAFMRLEGAPESSVFMDDLPEDAAANIVSTPRNFVIVADMLTTSPQDWERILLDLTEFVRAGIAVEDRLALVTIDNRGIPTVTHDFTVDHELIAEILEAQVGNSFATSDRERSFIDLSVILCDNGNCSDPEGGADSTACEPLATPRFYQCVTQQADWEDLKFRLAQAQLGSWSIEASLNAEKIMGAMTQVGDMLDLGDPYDRQKYVLLLSSGFERVPASIHHQVLVEYAGFSPALNPMEVRALSGDLSQKIVDLTEVMRRCRCTVYSLGTLGQAAFTGGTAQLPMTQPVVSRFQARTSLQGPLNALARDTGGKPFFGSDMSMGFQDVLEDARLRYVIGFVMDQPADEEPRWHDLEIEIDREDVDEVRARQGFYWPRR